MPQLSLESHAKTIPAHPTHQTCDAQASQAADPARPPERTFWHAFYYPEERRVRLSYYLGDEPHPGNERLVRPIRTDYLEFRLEPTDSAR